MFWWGLPIRHGCIPPLHSDEENIMKYNLDGKIFCSTSNSTNGEVGAETRFFYQHKGDVVSAEYSGGSIISGHLIAKLLPNGQLDMRYHHLNDKGELMLGKCLSSPTLLPDGKLQFTENWQWLSGDMSSGVSTIVEVEA